MPVFSSFKQNLMQPLIFYVMALFAIFAILWLLLWLAVPEIELNVLNAISTAFGLELPEKLIKSYSMTSLVITMAVILVAVLLMLINVIFEAVVTERLINPKVDIITSERGVLSKTWNTERKHILIRLLNFHHIETLDMKVKCVLAVHERFKTKDGELDDFIAYFPVHELTPESVLVMRPRMPWSIAIPIDQPIGNSINPDYKFNIDGNSIQSFRKNQNPIFIERTLELMITGIEPKSYARFVKHKKILVDRLDSNGYKLILHKGDFHSLPLNVKNKADVEQYVLNSGLQ